MSVASDVFGLSINAVITILILAILTSLYFWAIHSTPLSAESTLARHLLTAKEKGTAFLETTGPFTLRKEWTVSRNYMAVTAGITPDCLMLGMLKKYPVVGLEINKDTNDVYFYATRHLRFKAIVYCCNGLSTRGCFYDCAVIAFPHTVRNDLAVNAFMEEYESYLLSCLSPVIPPKS